MGEPVRVTHQGQEFKLCCKGCTKKFTAEADKYLEKLAAATKKYRGPVIRAESGTRFPWGPLPESSPRAATAGEEACP
jgi:hypothetical protein